MFPARFLVVFLVPLILVSFVIWLLAPLELGGKEVKVGGELVTARNLFSSLKDCYFASEQSSRVLIVDLTLENRSSSPITIQPLTFHLYLLKRDNLLNSVAEIDLIPLSYQAESPDEEVNIYNIPPGKRLDLSLRFSGETLPTGRAWEDYMLSLEYYDPQNFLFVDLLATPRETR